MRFYYVKPERILHDDGDINASYSAYKLANGESSGINPPFQHAGSIWCALVMLFFRQRMRPNWPRAEAWRLIPRGQWQHQVFSWDGITSEYESETRKRGNKKGLLVTYQGKHYVLAEKAVFIGVNQKLKAIRCGERSEPHQSRTRTVRLFPHRTL